MTDDQATVTETKNTRLVKTCPFCQSSSIAYRTRMHVYHCVRCGSKFKKPVLIEVTDERTFHGLPLHLKKKE